jgi:xanthine dehydrogenase/oxidase
MAPVATGDGTANSKPNVSSTGSTNFQDWATRLTFYLNAQRVVLENPDPRATLLSYIRSVGLTGTKLGCGEGGCGACTVVVASRDPQGAIRHRSINACLAPLVALEGKQVITVEAIGTPTDPHPAQERMAKFHGSQVGKKLSPLTPYLGWS